MSKEVSAISYCNGVFAIKIDRCRQTICSNEGFCFRQVQITDYKGNKILICNKYMPQQLS